MSAARGAVERRAEQRIERALLTAVVLAFKARRRVVLALGWITDHKGGVR